MGAEVSDGDDHLDPPRCGGSVLVSLIVPVRPPRSGNRRGRAIVRRVDEGTSNRSFDMRYALLAVVETDVFIETAGGAERLEFNRILGE
ncbi:MAG: hypothetical protein ACTHNH_09480 [Mesorhizobium sp.]